MTCMRAELPLLCAYAPTTHGLPTFPWLVHYSLFFLTPAAAATLSALDVRVSSQPQSNCELQRQHAQRLHVALICRLANISTVLQESVRLALAMCKGEAIVRWSQLRLETECVDGDYVD